MSTRNARLVSDQLERLPSGDPAITSAWRRFVNARSHRNLFGHPISADRFVAHALGHPSGVWTLQVSRNGEGALLCNDHAVARLSAHDGAILLGSADCPFEQAAEFIAALGGKAKSALHNEARTEFEFELARWITNTSI